MIMFSGLISPRADVRGPYEKNIPHPAVSSSSRTATALTLAPPHQRTAKNAFPRLNDDPLGAWRVPLYPCLKLMEENLLLTSLSLSTRKDYLRYARRIALWAGRDPALLSEDDLRGFFLHLKSIGVYAPDTIRIITEALDFLFVAVLGRADWPVL